MNDITIMLENTINKAELVSYFITNAFVFFGILINFIVYLFFKRKINVRKISNIFTFGIFSINSLVLFSIYIQNKILFGDFEFGLLDDNLILSSENTLLCFLVNLFFALFILTTYKLTKKARFNTSLINNCLLVLSATSSFLIQSESAIIAFMLFDVSAFFIYKYASNTRLRSAQVYSLDFITISALSTLLFYGFYLLLFFVGGKFQTAIIQSCICAAILLKAGLFPLYNHALARTSENNIPYSILIYSFLPFLGALTFLKFGSEINFLNEAFFITIITFMLIGALISGLFALKTKNMIRFLAHSMYCFSYFYLIGALILQDAQKTVISIVTVAFLVFGIYSLLGVLKINLKPQKINVSILKGLFLKNRLFVNLFSFSLLILVGVLPSFLLLQNYVVFKGIYEFDKFGAYVCIIFLFINMLILLNSLKMIKLCFTKKQHSFENIALKKRTTFNYAVPFLINVVLIVLLFLQVLNFFLH